MHRPASIIPLSRSFYFPCAEDATVANSVQIIKNTTSSFSSKIAALWFGVRMLLTQKLPCLLQAGTNMFAGTNKFARAKVLDLVYIEGRYKEFVACLLPRYKHLFLLTYSIVFFCWFSKN